MPGEAWGSLRVSRSAPLGLPRNAATGRQYSGINILILWCVVAECGFTGQKWLTLRQALAIGAHVRKGEKGTTGVYADRFVPYRERTRAAEAGDEPEAIPFLKHFTVFNTDQCEDLPADIAPPPEPLTENLVLPQAEALIRATGADLRIGGNRAFYVPSADYIQVPPPSAFFEPINFHRTVCHELGHNAERRIMPDGPGDRRQRLASHAAGRHNQSASRKASSLSSGRYRPGLASGAATRDSAFSFIRRSAWM